MECIIAVGVKLIGIGSGNITLQINVCNHVRYSVLPLVIELVLVEGIALVEDEGILIFSLTETPDSTNGLILLLRGYGRFDDDNVSIFLLQTQSSGTTQVSKYQRLWVRKLCDLSHNCGSLCRL